MENNGGDGSKGFHFEANIFGDEIMIPHTVIDSKISRMSLAVAKDSGWYEIDLDLGHTFFWGKNEGCLMFRNTCSSVNVSEFCDNVNRMQCDDNNMYITACSKIVFNENCPINLNIISCKTFHVSPHENFYYGYDAVCLNTLV